MQLKQKKCKKIFVIKSGFVFCLVFLSFFLRGRVVKINWDFCWVSRTLWENSIWSHFCYSSNFLGVKRSCNCKTKALQSSFSSRARSLFIKYIFHQYWRFIGLRNVTKCETISLTLSYFSDSGNSKNKTKQNKKKQYGQEQWLNFFSTLHFSVKHGGSVSVTNWQQTYCMCKQSRTRWWRRSRFQLHQF